MTTNREVFDKAADSYRDLSLMPPERVLLNLLRDRLPDLAMLDLGVGAGRTGYTFAGLVDRYVGLDYSPRMIARSQALLAGTPGVELVLADAATISPELGSFDVVLFSFNGIDAAPPEDREPILAGVRSVLKDDGYFLFSTHSLRTLPFDERRPLSPRLRSSRLYRVYAAVMSVPYAYRIRKANRALDLAAAHRQGWALVHSMAHDFTIKDVYVDPAHQVAELERLGFRVEKILDPDGNETSLDRIGREAWFDYLCRPA
jgi:SAM-dependent methyltransferase